MVDRDTSSQEQAFKQERRRALHALLAGHIAIDGASISLDDQGTIHAVTPDITKDSTLFAFRDNDDVGAFYDLVKGLGEFRISITVPSIEQNARYVAFGVTTFNRQTPRDHEVFEFLIRLGNQLGANTTIGTLPHEHRGQQ
jgi:hypothetical protein